MKNAIKNRLYSGETSLGTWISIGNPDVVDILKHLGFDWFVFDTEHSYISFETVKTMMQALGESKVTPMVRVGQVDQLLIKRALDVGGQGLVVPLVNSAEEAERVVRYAMYPPNGVRGAGPGRASLYGMEMPKYLREANQELLLAVQIETMSALSNLNEIVGTKGVDIGFAGPSDLTMSLGLIDERSNPKVIEAMNRVVKACNDHGKIPGTLAVSLEEAVKFAKLGFKFIALASDSRMLIQGAKAFLQVREQLAH